MSVSRRVRRSSDIVLANRLASQGDVEGARRVRERHPEGPMAAIEVNVTVPTAVFDEEPTRPVERYVSREEIAASEAERLRALRRIPRGCASCGLYDHELPPCGADCSCLCHERLSEAVGRLGTDAESPDEVVPDEIDKPR